VAASSPISCLLLSGMTNRACHVVLSSDLQEDLSTYSSSLSRGGSQHADVRCGEQKYINRHVHMVKIHSEMGNKMSARETVLFRRRSAGNKTFAIREFPAKEIIPIFFPPPPSFPFPSLSRNGRLRDADATHPPSGGNQPLGPYIYLPPPHLGPKLERGWGERIEMEGRKACQ
jgi:hypothetical protein